MAGRRQHILPRFLLRNFAAKVQGDQVFSWVYRKGAAPFCTNIRNAAVESDFYGNPEGAGNSADDMITSLEGDYAALVAELLATPPQQVLEPSEIAAFVAHLSGRTKNFRLAFSESAQWLVLELRKFLTTPGCLVQLLNNEIQKPGAVEALLQDKLPPHLNTPEGRKNAAGIARAVLPQWFAQNGEMLARKAEAMLANLVTAVPGASGDGHIICRHGKSSGVTAFWRRRTGLGPTLSSLES